MDWLIYYIIFALSTSICAWLFYFMPAIKEAKQRQVENSFTNSPILSSIVYVVISTFIAPTIFLALFSDRHAQLFRKALREEILKQN